MSTKNRTTRLRAVLALLGITLTFLVSPGMTAVSRADNCSSLLVIAARGSSEPYDAATLGMGPTNFDAYRAIKARVSDARGIGLPYEAIAPMPNLLKVVFNLYWGSLDTGKAMLGNIIAKQIASCPDQRIVLLGYSQGGHLVADTLSAFEMDPAIRAHIVGVLIFGDPRFNPRSPFNRGDYNSKLQGLWAATGIATARTISPAWWEITRSYCAANDFVCNSSAMSYIRCPEGSSCGHFSYVKTGAAMSAGAWLGNRLRG